MSIFDAVRAANRPGPPEHSVALRVAAAGAVIIGIAACWAEGELSWTVAAADRARRGRQRLLLPAGGSDRCRGSSPSSPLIAVAAFVWFFRQLTGQTISDLGAVEGPLAVLFTWMQVTHAFDVPAAATSPSAWPARPASWPWRRPRPST